MARRRRFDVRPLSKEEMRFDVPETSAILKYLHGDVSSREMEAAVYWEYCRLNAAMIRIASLYREFVNCNSHDPMTDTMVEANSDEFMSELWAPIWSSASFPATSWFDLDPAQKKDILVFFAAPVRKALSVADLRLINAMKILEEWKRCVDEARKAGKRERIPARYQDGAQEYVIFALNYHEGLDRAKKQFADWLHESEQAGLFASYQKRRVGRDKGRKKLIDMLRTLAIRRVFKCANGNAAAAVDWLIQNQQENRKYPEQRKSGCTEREIRKAVKRSCGYEVELFSKTGLEL
jgi:hypothetical protein